MNDGKFIKKNTIEFEKFITPKQTSVEKDNMSGIKRQPDLKTEAPKASN